MQNEESMLQPNRSHKAFSSFSDFHKSSCGCVTRGALLFHSQHSAGVNDHADEQLALQLSTYIQ